MTSKTHRKLNRLENQNTELNQKKYKNNKDRDKLYLSNKILMLHSV